MEPQHEKRRLTTILAADVVGYSRLMAADEAGTYARLSKGRRIGEHRRLLLIVDSPTAPP